MSAAPSPPVKVLFVCSGNTCRSPFAAAVARREGLEGSSAGLDVIDERAADDAVAVASEFGIDLRPHRTRRLTDELRDGADLVVGMSARHATRVLGGGVEDPYGGGREAYRRAYAQIERAVVELAEEMR